DAAAKELEALRREIEEVQRHVVHRDPASGGEAGGAAGDDARGRDPDAPAPARRPVGDLLAGGDVAGPVAAAPADGPAEAHPPLLFPSGGQEHVGGGAGGDRGAAATA